jgi:hypothetical protein
LKPYCAFETDPKTRIRFWFPKCMGGAEYGVHGCTCERPRRLKASVLAQVPTEQLLAALSERTGVSSYFVAMAEPYHIVIGGGREQGLGSARILVVPTGESS